MIVLNGELQNIQNFTQPNYETPIGIIFTTIIHDAYSALPKLFFIQM